MTGPPGFPNPLFFVLQIAFSLLSIFLCFLIHFKTKDMYELTKYQGIKYFRNAFLFFGLSYLLKFCFSLLFISRVAFDFNFRDFGMPFFILALGYVSTVATFYLMLGSTWKKEENKSVVAMTHAVAFALSIATFITRSPKLLIALQCILLVIALCLNFRKSEKKKVSSSKILYSLVSIFWLLNLLIILNRRPFSIEFEVVAQVLSLAVFFIVYKRLSKWVK